MEAMSLPGTRNQPGPYTSPIVRFLPIDRRRVAMPQTSDPTPTLNTTVGDFSLEQCRLEVGGREWRVLHTGTAISYEEEVAYFGDDSKRLPYGVSLWPSAIALAHEV